MDLLILWVAALPDPLRFIAIFFLLVLGLLWLLLPFAVVSIQKQTTKTRESCEAIERRLKENNQQLHALTRILSKTSAID